MAQSRPSRVIQPTAKLGADNAGEIVLKSHKQAIERARQQPVVLMLPVPDPLPSQSTVATMATTALSTVPDEPSVVHSDSEPEDAPSVKASKRRIVESEGSDGDANTTPNKQSPRRRKAKKKKTKRASQGTFTNYYYSKQLVLLYHSQAKTMSTMLVCIRMCTFKILARTTTAMTNRRH